ncbi:hypothetical protein MMC09_000703 [Bachmanniomyces sp. S44760]|nr:hypothetical protein [Bachmanniomyces sp. S44760]
MVEHTTNEKLTSLDQVMPRVYTRLILCFPTSNEQSGKAASLLREAFEQTLKDIPVLRDDVITSPTRAGELQLQSAPADKSATFVLKDLTTSGSGWKSTYSDLLLSEAPISALDDQVLAPVGMMPKGSSAPVAAAQLNIITGGSLLCVCFHHSVVDGAGVGTILRLWASHCRALQHDVSSDVPAFRLEDGSLDRQPLLKGGRESSSAIDAAYEIPSITPQAQDKTSAAGSSQGPTPAIPPMTASVFGLDMLALTSLKHDLSEDLDERGLEDVWLSTQDALCAVLWHAVTTARTSSDLTEADEGADSKPLRLGLAVNGRARLEPALPETYIGNVNVYAGATVNRTTLMSTSVPSMAKTASAIRQSIRAVDDAYIRNLIKNVDGLADPSVVTPAFKSFLGNDLAITSWLDLGLYDLNWGPAVGGTGKIDSVRIPAATFDGLCIILPRTLDDEVEVLVGLKTEHMDRLKKDHTFLRYATFKSD